MSETGNKWYVLRAVSGKEAKLKEYIDAEIKHNELHTCFSGDYTDGEACFFA